MTGRATFHPEPHLEHLDEEMVRRVTLTLSCRDTDAIPKVDGAGEVFEREGSRLQRMHNGVVIEADCYYGPWMTEIIRGLRGHHEPQEELVFHAILQRILATEVEPRMVELGSWWAYYSLWFAAEARRGDVLAIEPDQAKLDVGRRNFALNGLPGRFVHGAVGSEALASASFVLERTAEAVLVPHHDLASVLALSGGEPVSVILADVQGAETALLAGGRDVLEAGGVRFLVLSTHHHSISGSPTTHQDARDVLGELGAHLVAEHTVGESYSGDGLIAVSFDERDRDLRVEISRARYRESLFGELEPELGDAWRTLDETRCELSRLRRHRMHSALGRVWPGRRA